MRDMYELLRVKHHNSSPIKKENLTYQFKSGHPFLTPFVTQTYEARLLFGDILRWDKSV